MSAAETWDYLVKIALLGTEQQKPTLPEAVEGFDTLLQQLDTADAEKTLLSSAGTFALARRAGYAPPKISTLPTPDSAEQSLPRCPDLVGADLLYMLSGKHQDCLEVWFKGVAIRKWRVPEEALPLLLGLGNKNKNLRAGILPVLGERGRWLAAQNPEWAWVFSTVASEDEPLPLSLWETGNRAERTAFLQTLRRSNPNEARTLLEESWSTEPYEERSAFLETFHINLSMLDEPFLETALDDKRKSVRIEARRCLARLPQSRYCQRMTERGKPILNLVRVMLKPDYFDIVLPAAHDKTMERDGIDKKPPAGVGEKAYWLIEILQAVPLNFWTETFQKTPEQIVKTQIPREWRDNVLQAWTIASGTQRNTEWAEALLYQWMELQSNSIPTHLIAWNEVLPKAVLERATILLMDKVNPIFRWDSPLKTFFDMCGPTWGEELAHKYLQKLRAFTKTLKKENSYLSYHQNEIASYIPISLQDEFCMLWEKSSSMNDYHRSYYVNFIEKVAFAREIRAHIQKG